MQTAKINQVKEQDLAPPFSPLLSLYIVSVYLCRFFLTTYKYTSAAEYRIVDISVCQEG